MITTPTSARQVVLRSAHQVVRRHRMPDQSELVKSDTVKDIAAMANSGGGLIVFGVDEVEKHATGRCDVGEISENYERTLRQVAVHAIHPPCSISTFGAWVKKDNGLWP